MLSSYCQQQRTCLCRIRRLANDCQADSHECGQFLLFLGACSRAELACASSPITTLNCQLELLDPAAGLLVACVEAPIKTGPSERPIWMYYGNSLANRTDGMGLYDSDQTVVL
jgi:hypothetical protein